MRFGSRAPVRSQAARTRCVERFGGFVVGDERRRQGALGGADKEGKIEGAGGDGEAGDTTAPRAAR